MTPTTAGGQQLLGTLPYGDYGERWFGDAIAGVEAEARQQERARLAGLVAAIPADSTCFCEADRDLAHDEPDGSGPIYVRRAAVLALLREDPR